MLQVSEAEVNAAICHRLRLANEELKQRNQAVQTLSAENAGLRAQVRIG